MRSCCLPHGFFLRVVCYALFIKIDYFKLKPQNKKKKPVREDAASHTSVSPPKPVSLLCFTKEGYQTRDTGCASSLRSHYPLLRKEGKPRVGFCMHSFYLLYLLYLLLCIESAMRVSFEGVLRERCASNMRSFYLMLLLSRVFLRVVVALPMPFPFACIP